MRRGVRALIGALLLTGALAGAAQAGGPTKSTVIDEGEFDISCGTFTLHETYRDQMKIQEWFDASGEVVRAKVHHSWTGTITGPGGILTLNDPGHWTDFHDANGVRQVGIVYKLIVKGMGLIAHDVGQIAFDQNGEVRFIKGPHDVFEQGLETIICPLFQ